MVPSEECEWIESSSVSALFDDPLWSLFENPLSLVVEMPG
jgi:hypothetical protein